MANKKPAKEKKAPKGTMENPHRLPKYSEPEDYKKGVTEYVEIEEWDGRKWQFVETVDTKEQAENRCRRFLKEYMQRIRTQQEWEHQRKYGAPERPFQTRFQVDGQTTVKSIEEFANSLKEQRQKFHKKDAPKFEFKPPKGKAAPAFRWTQYQLIKRSMSGGEVR